MPKPTAYRVPALADISTEYAELVAKRAALQARQHAAASERRDVLRQIEEAPEPAYRRGVAELLGERGDSTSVLRERLKELTALDRDLTQAIEVLRQRIQTARTAASREACALIRPEYGRRVIAICDALEAVAAARASYDELRDQLEAEDIAWGSLVPMVPTFLGDPRDGHVQRYLKEARDAGYVH